MPWTVIRALLLWAGAGVQVVLLLLVWQAVDISIGIAELWVELARKHLEITL